MNYGRDVSAIILAGGRGTRSADPSRAKVIQAIEGESLLSRHMRLLEASSVSETVIVTGHLAQQIDSEFQRIALQRPVKKIHELDPSGTVAATALAAASSNATHFIVILGDILCSFDIDLFLKEWEASGKDVAVIVHPSTHPEDSDKVFSDAEGRVRVISKGTSSEFTPNLSSAGIFAISKDAIQRYSCAKDIGSEVLAMAAEDDTLFCWNDSHYFKDTGTPGRLEEAREDVVSGAFARRGFTGLRRGLFLDRDGVLNAAFPEIYSPDDYELQPGIGAEIRAINQSGLPVFVLTNQPGIAKGFMTAKTHMEIVGAFDAALSREGAFCDEYKFCPHHPESGFDGEVIELKVNCDCRKPRSGMAIDIATRHNISLADSIMVGDTWRDLEMAKAVDMQFFHVANEACFIGESHTCFATPMQAVAEAHRVIKT